MARLKRIFRLSGIVARAGIARRASLFTVLVSLAALVAASALFLGGTLSTQDRAQASNPANAASIACSELLLGELLNPVGTSNPAKPWPIEQAVPRGRTYFPTAKSLTYSELDPITDDTDSSGVTLNLNIPGIIPGALRVFEECASVTKVEATVDANPGTVDPATGVTLSITETGNEGPPLPVGMLLYWNSTNASQAGFWVVTASSVGSVTIVGTDASCNGVPTAGSEPGDLRGCEPANKNVEVFAYANPDVSKGGLQAPGSKPRAEPGADENCTGPFTHIPYGPDGVPITTCGTGYDWIHEVSYSVTCAVTADLENPPASLWTRVEIYTKVSGSASRKVPTYGVAQLFSPVAPNSCVNTAETTRSTNAIVAWGLDSAVVEGDRANWDSDYDGDGCLDWQELDFPQPASPQGDAGQYKGGRDPFNPFDCGRNLTGIWSITGEIAPAVLEGDNTITPGAYYRCRAYIDHDKGTDDFTVTPFCYLDIPGVPVNPEAGSESGDGLPGSPYPIGEAPPPEPYADVDDQHNTLTGHYDAGADTISLSGCFVDRDGYGPGGHTYINASAVDVLSGHGTAVIYAGQTLENCLGGNPQGASAEINIQIGILAGKEGGKVLVDAYDYDLDNCPDKNELSNDQSHGGLRDPFNPWDYFNPTHDGLNRVDDILKVVGQYFCDQGTCGTYTTDTDRTAVIGANPWNLNKPNGQQRVDDILAAVKSYFHDCSIP